MLLDLVYSVLGELPNDLRFLYAFGVIFVMYIFLKMFVIFVDVIKDFLKSL